MTRAIVVMGVSGCGKSSLAAGLASALGWCFVEGDDCHPAANVAKMAAGIPLSDADRQPFLHTVATRLAASPTGAVASCSALRRAYRDTIRAKVDTALFVLPMLPPATLLARLRNRPGHFMPPSLLDSQLAALELPDAEENALLIDGCWPTDRQIAAVRAEIDL